MKVGVLTFVRAINYGAALQAYALQCVLSELDCEVELLDVRRTIDFGSSTNKNTSLSRDTDKQTILSVFRRAMFKCISRVANLFFIKRYKKRILKFKKFQENEINISKKIYKDIDSLYSSDFDHNKFVVGSDQVWNYKYTFSVEPYFLTFVKDKPKIAYAASMGVDKLPEYIEKKYQEWLSDFDAISLRETRGSEIISDLLNKSIETVLDPTILLSRDDWSRKLSINKSEFKEKYVLVYLLANSKKSIELAIDVAKKMRCKVKVIVPSSWSQYFYISGMDLLYNVGPKEYIDLFLNASFVVTNSFHGTAFSVNFNIPFYCTARHNLPTISRFVSLLSETGLIDRLKHNGKLDSEIELEIDFSYANEVLMKKRESSIDFLKRSLQVN